MKKVIKMSKKGVELTFNTIVIAAICLIALIVVIAIFTNFMGRGTQGFTDISACQSMGNGQGECRESDDSSDTETCIYKYGGCGFEEDDTKSYCCFPK